MLRPIAGTDGLSRPRRPARQRGAARSNSLLGIVGHLAEYDNGMTYYSVISTCQSSLKVGHFAIFDYEMTYYSVVSTCQSSLKVGHFAIFDYEMTYYSVIHFIWILRK